ncbi:hypothetical protein [Luteibacter sp. E-22]|uniref:hypothetical protein n=1 Tax=Luteibacter sp. E-22 TaxID=3404050 RepID=UPI003CF72AA8
MTPEQQHQWNLEIFRSLADAGKGALNTLVLVSGGSGAAILSFISGLAGKGDKPEAVHGLMFSISFFYAAFVLAAVIAGMSYVAQGHYKRSTYLVDTDRKKSDEHEEKGDRLSFWLAVTYVIAVVALVVGGAIAVYAGWTAL